MTLQPGLCTGTSAGERCTCREGAGVKNGAKPRQKTAFVLRWRGGGERGTTTAFPFVPTETPSDAH